MAKVDIAQLRKELSAQADKVIYPIVREKLNDKFKTEKEKFFDKFNEHPVTQELEVGPAGVSDYVSTSHGGNLFSLLGFVDRVDPIVELRDYLDKNITKGQVKKANQTGDKIIYTLDVKVPTYSEIKNKTRLLTWINRSWLDMIEEGKNFVHYLFDDTGRLQKYSRSGTAIQIKGNINTGRSFKPVRGYVRSMLEEFYNRLDGKKVR